MGRAPVAGGLARDLRPIARQQLRIEQALGGGLFLGLGGSFMQARFDPRLVGQAHDPGEQLEVGGGAETQRAQIGLGQEFEREGDQDAARGRRRVGQDPGAAVAPLQRLPFDRAIGSQVRHGDLAALVAAVGDQALAEFAVVK